MMTVVVGAGLAGLTCAKVLTRAGCPCLVFEAAGVPGGRVVSGRTPDGYILDRGFQVLLSSYPSARKHLDLVSLGGGAFRSGALFVGDGAPRTLENPLRNPLSALAAFGGVLPAVDMVRLAFLTLAAVRGGGADIKAEDFLRGRGFSEKFFARFAIPFFGGVLLDPALSQSSSLLLGYLRRFATGLALLPGAGIGAIAGQLASRLQPESVRYACRVERVLFDNGRARGVVLESGEHVAADNVVLAADEPSVCRLLGRGEPRRAFSTAVHYFAAGRAFHRGGWICLPPFDSGNPVLHAALLTNVAPSLAPAGRHLWSVTVKPDHPRAHDAEFVAAVVASWFRADRSELQPLDFIRVLYAVPAQPPGFQRRPAPWGELPPGLLVAGDAVSGASIDAAMASGEAAAKKLILSAAGN
ncbi:MAG: FAD-dependent oxidoreductase [Chthoniobacterales bacterium]|nr:FAD-dependent oxidoreductase [Chthoniobacterales bacterium]